MQRTSHQIAQHNDLFRSTMIGTVRHKVSLSESVQAATDREQIITEVRAFKDFSEGNDPHGEHDFGSVTVNDNEYFFKIDYYDTNFEFGADPYTQDYGLLLTIMRSDEY